MVSADQAPESESPPEPSGRRWALSAATWEDLAGVVAVVLAALVLALILFGRRPTGPRGPATSMTPGVARQLMSLPPRAGIPASFDLAGAVTGEDLVLTEGTGLDLSFRVEVPARAVVLEEQVPRQLVLLYPPAGRGAEVLEAGQRVRVTASDGGPLVIINPPGQRRVRLIVFPAEIDPLALQPTELARLGSGLTVVEHRYRAVWRGESR